MEIADGVGGVSDVVCANPGFLFVCILVPKPLDIVAEWALETLIELRVEDLFNLELQIIIDLHWRWWRRNSIWNVGLVVRL